METKSRYEIIEELEGKKAELLNQKANFNLNVMKLKREAEESTRRAEEYESQKDIFLANLQDQLESIEKSLNRLDSQKK